MDKAAQITDPTARRKAWANVDKMIVMDAPAIPEIWSSNALRQGLDGQGRPRQLERRLESVVQRAEVGVNVTGREMRGAAVSRRSPTGTETAMGRYIIRRLLWVIVLLSWSARSRS